MDSENICTGQGYLVLQAAKWAADGLPPKNISMRLQGLAKRVELSFVLNQLDYMAKSGRCSGVLAFGANILGIKPSLAVIDGELKVVRKYRGSLPICVGKYVTDQLANREDIDRSMVFISSTQAKPGCMEAIKAGLRQYGNFENVYETDIGTTIGGYSGPGTIGIVFARKQEISPCTQKRRAHHRVRLFCMISGFLSSAVRSLPRSSGRPRPWWICDGRPAGQSSPCTHPARP